MRQPWGDWEQRSSRDPKKRARGRPTASQNRESSSDPCLPSPQALAGIRETKLKAQFTKNKGSCGERKWEATD